MQLDWNTAGNRRYDAGLDRGVFYPAVGAGISWNGLTAIKETPNNVGSLAIYVDGQKKENQLQLGEFAATIDAFTYPDEFLAYDGYAESKFSGQKRSLFGLSYRQWLGSDTEDLGHGYILHLVYNCLVNPTQRANASLNDASDISTFSWSLSTTPLAFPYERPTSHLRISSLDVVPAVLVAIENILYGTDSTDPRIPTIAEVLAIFDANAVYVIIDNGNGTLTATGPDEGIFASGTDLWTLEWPAALELDDITYKVSSY